VLIIDDPFLGAGRNNLACDEVDFAIQREAGQLFQFLRSEEFIEDDALRAGNVRPF
jgi:hypothetical protein